MLFTIDGEIEIFPKHKNEAMQLLKYHKFSYVYSFHIPNTCSHFILLLGYFCKFRGDNFSFSLME